MNIKPLREPSLNAFCAIYEDAKGQANITCPANYNIQCLRALESRGLIVWDLERTNGKTRRFCALTKLGAKYACEQLGQLAHSDTGNKSQRDRRWVKMQFDIKDPDYKDAHDIACGLLSERLLSGTVADLLRIHQQAEKGDYRLFYELYGIPETKETNQFEGMIKAFDDMRRDMQSTIDKLMVEVETLRKNHQAPQAHENSAQKPVGLKAMSTQGIGLKGAGLGSQVSLPPPVFDDSDDDLPVLEITKAKDSGKSANLNLINAMKSLQNS